MLNIKRLLIKLLKRECIVSTTNENGWTCDKYKSGRMTCRRVCVWENVTLTAATGGGYAERSLNTAQMPPSLLYLDVAVATIECAGFGALSLVDKSASSITFRISRLFSGQTLPRVIIDVILEGRWK